MKDPSTGSNRIAGNVVLMTCAQAARRMPTIRFLRPKAIAYTALSKAALAPHGVPDGDPAICQANAKGDEAVRSIAGSTVE